ncbi:7141_t:CDS:2 [Entrophospora sp. SA101]|nr:7141_t:CDS:2 [Entrophospora sp. SA101]CAJ0839387.1 6625_t:CDS:2 [Entrophospora sp. SA101]CAJ0875272.1 10890_t:CDS:2 [Entrophospora sp. SA101]
MTFWAPSTFLELLKIFGDEFASSINIFPSAPLSKFSTTGPPLPPKFTSQQPILLSDFSDQPDPNASAFYEQNPQYQ